MVQQKVAPKDLLLMSSLSFLIYDIACDWRAYRICPKPIHKWLVVSYVMIAGWRLIVVIASLISSTETREVLLNLRHENSKSRMMVSFSWLAVPPLVLVWSVLGSAWIWEVMTSSPDCMPSALHLAFLVVWQVLCYAWLATSAFVGKTAWAMENRVRRAEHDIREIEDEDSLRRWGRVGDLEGYAALPATMAGGGLTPAEIRSLPGVGCRSAAEADVDVDCPICLNPLQVGETVRELHACNHEFHKSCIDLWLLRSTDCPMCKTKVSGGV